MGNMLPCLVHARTILPTMNSKHRSHSIKLLTRTLPSIKGRRCSSNKAKVTRETSAESDQSRPSSIAAPRRGRKKQGVVRFKVILTRKDAARLLALTAHGERAAAQVLSELRSMEAAGRSNAATTAWRPSLESIPEEWY